MPKLKTITNIELLAVGENWHASTGDFSVTAAHLQAAVEAQNDPAVVTPIIKLGHLDSRFNVERNEDGSPRDGQPSVGQIKNIRVNASGDKLIGDAVGVPQWLADVIPSAFPRRSIEGEFHAKTASGATHDLVITGLALLGEEYPAVTTLADIEAIYDADSIDDVQMVAASSGTNAEKVPLRSGVVYAATAGPIQIAKNDPSNTAKNGKTTDSIIANKVEKSEDGMTAEQLEVIGLPADASAEQIAERLSHLVTLEVTEGDKLPGEGTETEVVTAAPGASPDVEVEPAVAPQPAGTVVIDEAEFQNLKIAASRANELFEEKRREQREQILASAVRDGKFPPARVDHWRQSFDADPEGTEQTIKTLASGLVPVTEMGYGSGLTTIEPADDAYPSAWLPRKAN